MEPNYFTCTLGEAYQYQQGKAFVTVNDLINDKAKHEGQLPAVGFYDPHQKGTRQWKFHVLTFKDVRDGSATVAEKIVRKLDAPVGQTVALLCASSAEFLFTWLALVRLGHPTLLIAPQCSPSAIAHLCKTCKVKYLIVDNVYEDLASKASAAYISDGNASLLLKLPLPFAGENIFEVIRGSASNASTEQSAMNEDNIAYLHHTSGTSSGVPKPIAQTHRAAVGVLPSLDGRSAATFTTTPLYHGGIADLFRAWTSNALIWLFPGKELPITAANVCKCLDVAAEAHQTSRSPSVKYFSSVPYILQIMADDEKGLKHLQSMEIVGVGGAALPPEVGNKLVEQGVNLISRFGSAECGFLMSSHRDYALDKEWQYLRSSSRGECLQFEDREDGLSELIIRQGWPHMAKCNRDDGSYATSDLFAPHPSISNAWQYHSRSDSQLTLITGKKFDPAPLEDAIKASSSVIDDVLIFGNGRPYPGALLFRKVSASSVSDKEIVANVSAVVEKLNKESQSHARISRNMLIPMPHREGGLEKSSKGTIIRSTAEEVYADKVEAAYNNLLPHGNGHGNGTRNGTRNIPDSEVAQVIREIVTSVIGQDKDSVEPLTDDTDLFSYGADSVACIQIRHALSRLVPGATALPVSVVEDSGTIARLSRCIISLRSGEDVREQDDQLQLMSDLVKEYSIRNPKANRQTRIDRQSRESKANTGFKILLTGPTGSLGSHILHQMLKDPRVGHIFLLVRGASEHASRERVVKALTSRRLQIPSTFDSKITILPCKLSDPHVGLSQIDYELLTANIDIILHLAWSVNFLISLRTIAGTHLAGLRNLLNLALQHPSDADRPLPPRFIFCSSVAAISSLSVLDLPTTVPEHFIADPRVSGPTGYARSKWVGEAICAEAHKSTRLRNRISVTRVGQLSGATDTGVWSKSEAYPLLLSSAKSTGVLPDLNNEVLNWLPVDMAARAFVEHALRDPGKTGGDSAASNLPVYHVLNPNMDIRWNDLLDWLSPHGSFKIVPTDEWIASLAALRQDEKAKDHPALRLLEFWRRVYASARNVTVDEDYGTKESVSSHGYQMASTYRSMPSLKDASGIMEGSYRLKLWEWIQREV